MNSKSSSIKKLSNDEIMKIYLNISRSYPLSCKSLESYHPDNLPKVLKDQIKHHPSIRKFAHDVYSTLMTKGIINYPQFDNIIGSFNVNTTPIQKTTPSSSPQKSPMKKLSYNDLFKLYISLSRNFPMTFGVIVAIYHPDNLPQIIQEQMKKYPNIDIFCKKVYAELVSEGIIYNETQFENILSKHMRTSSYSTKKTPLSKSSSSKNINKSPIKKIRYSEILDIYTSMTTTYPVTYKKLLLIYHPDKIAQNVPMKLQEQIANFPDVANLYARWFNKLRLHRKDFSSKTQLEKLLLTEKM